MTGLTPAMTWAGISTGLPSLEGLVRSSRPSPQGRGRTVPGHAMGGRRALQTGARPAISAPSIILRRVTGVAFTAAFLFWTHANRSTPAWRPGSPPSSSRHSAPWVRTGAVAVLGRDRPTVQIMVDRRRHRRLAGGLRDAWPPFQRGDERRRPDARRLDAGSQLPGIDRPLTRVKDWNRFAGHLAAPKPWLRLPAQAFLRHRPGADDSAARLRLDDGTEVALPLADVRRAKLVLTTP